MSFNHTDLSLPNSFANIVRLFPLPNLVLFPGVVQALHLFEPRYVEMMKDSLAGDGLITMALVQPDSIASSSEAQIAQTVCIGKVISHTDLPGGKFNLFLVGTKRARIVKELESNKPYRMAEVQIVEDIKDDCFDYTILRYQIVAEFRKLATLQTDWNHEALDPFLNDDLPFGQLIDMISYASGAEPTDQQLILETPQIGKRGELVLQLLKRQVIDKQGSVENRSFPPDFSLN